MGYTILSLKTRVARIEHECIWCSEEILSGSRYVDEASVYNGDFQSHHWHVECAEASQDYFSRNEHFQPGEFARGTTQASQRVEDKENPNE